MAGLSDWAENGLLDWWFRNQTFTIPATCYWRLYSANPNFETGVGGTEMVATGYTAGGQAITMSGWWSVASQGANGGYRLTNTGSITWSCGAADWEAVTGVGLWTSNSGGSLILGGAYSATPGNGDTVRIAAGAIDHDFDVTTKAGVTSYVNEQFAKKLGAATPDAPPTTQYIALYTVAPDIKTGAGGTEVSTSGTAYARTSLTPATGWDAAAAGATQNAAQIDWTLATATWGAGGVVAAAVVDTASGAPSHYHAVDSFTAVLVETGDDFYIADGAFDLAVD